MQREDHRQHYLRLSCVQVDFGCSSEEDPHRRTRSQKIFSGQGMGSFTDDTWFRSPESWFLFVQWIISHWLADRLRELLPEGQYSSQDPAESASWTSSWTSSGTTCKERQDNGGLSRGEWQRVPVQFGSGRGKSDDKRDDIERWAHIGMQSLRLPQWWACFPNSRSFSTAYGQVAFWTYHIRAQKQSQRQQTKMRLHRKETGDQHECSHYFRWKGFYSMISQAPGDRQVRAYRNGWMIICSEYTTDDIHLAREKLRHAPQ